MGFDPNTGVTDVILGIGAVLALVTLVRSRRSFLDADFTVADRHVAMQVAVFLVPPAVVLLHELAHAVAVAAVGGHVTDFHYGLFEGSVSFAGGLTDSQVWFVALAGNVVSIGIGVAMVAAGGLLGGVRRPLRYLLIVGGLIEAVFGPLRRLAPDLRLRRQPRPELGHPRRAHRRGGRSLALVAEQPAPDPVRHHLRRGSPAGRALGGSGPQPRRRGGADRLGQPVRRPRRPQAG